MRRRTCRYVTATKGRIMYFQGTMPTRVRGASPKSTLNLPCIEGIDNVDIWLQAEADRMTDQMQAGRVRVRFVPAIMSPGEQAPPLQPFARYIYPNLAFPLLNAYYAMTGNAKKLEPEILISERLRHAPAHALRALTAHELGHHLSVQTIIAQSRAYQRRANKLTIALTTIFLLMGVMQMLSPNIGWIMGMVMALMITVVWTFVIAPHNAQLFQERQRQHWEFLADRWGEKLHGPTYLEDLDQLRIRYMDPEEYEAALALDIAENRMIREARNKTISMQLWRNWRSLTCA